MRTPALAVAISLSVSLSVLLSAAPAAAKDFYVDPQAGAPSGDGSATKPWRTLQEVIDAKLVSTRAWDALPYKPSAKLVPKNASGPIKAGDTIWLRSGYHGALTISSHYNSAVITVAAESGHTPRFSKVLIRSSSNWHLRGLEISPSFAPTYKKDQMLSVQSHSHQGPVEEVTVEACKLFSVPDITSWTAKDWNDKAANGIGAGGTKITLRNNRVENVNFAISVTATHSLVIGNWIENFSGDGLRGLGDYTTFENNTVKNCYDVNDNHDDGFQSWSVKDGKVGTGQVVGIVLRGNTIINYTDPNQPLRGPLQGIGCFDGMFVDWVIENNVIITDHWHGITLLGAKNVRVVNNTVLDPNGAKPGPPWIQVAKHKNGTAASGCVVRNNLVTALNNDKTGVTEDHNIIIGGDAAKHFVDVAAYDLHLLPTSSAVDKGSSQQAPKTDADGVPRPQGSAVDVGAYEWSKNPPPVGDTGPGAPDIGPSGDGSIVGDSGGASDSAIGGDGATPPGDGASPSVDGASPSVDGQAGADLGGRASVDDGCSVRGTRETSPTTALLLLGLLLGAILARRRR
jgi:MYXO-CTERM domain-containing protein